MPVLRSLKVATLQTLEGLGLFSRVGASKWRQRRLLILCYHGVALEDEHEWSNAHVSAAHLRRRFEILREQRFTVLPLSAALERLSVGELPPRSVVLTFDEGLYDFCVKALPLLKEFELPITLYVPTYYARFRRPIFDLACSYFLWKGRGRQIDTARLLPESPRVRIPLIPAEREALHLAMRSHVNTAGLTAAEKDAMLAELSGQVGIDWDTFLASRMLQLMSPEEFAALDRRYVDVQLHTHRHRTPRERDLFMRELDDNIAALKAMGFRSEDRIHFCYPSGDADPLFYPWLEARGIQSATTCDPQIVTRDTCRLSLPRVIDTMSTTEVEFRGWVTGVSSFLPRRTRGISVEFDITELRAGGGTTDHRSLSESSRR